ncbi:chitinase [Arthrobacter sp. OAP107]|uniref:chitinase n=1 Tax=Arthrobacter sp. OAP107 TaxID=3156445 RepID=UPI0033942CCF
MPKLALAKALLAGATLLGVVVTSACDAPPSGGVTTTQQMSAPATAQAGGVPWFGGYFDTTLVPSKQLEHSSSLGSVTTVLSFIVADPKSPCEPSWDGFYDLEQAGSKLNLDAQVEQFRHQGNDVAVAFGGQLGTELAVACTDEAALAQAYSAVISKYGLDVIDLDIEDPGLADAAAAKRRSKAIAQLQQERGPDAPLKVWLTLPVSDTGLTSEGEFGVKTMLEAGVELTGVNIMVMNFGPLDAGQSMLGASTSAANGTHAMLSALYRKAGKPLDSAAVWKRIGLTPMVGINDVKGQTFTLSDAEGLNAFALEQGISRISMWSVNRDGPCPQTKPSQSDGKPSDNCSGVKQQPGEFAKLLSQSYTG